eukprot:4918971-Prymnesium_polylepis.1
MQRSVSLGASPEPQRPSAAPGVRALCPPGPPQAVAAVAAPAPAAAATAATAAAAATGRLPPGSVVQRASADRAAAQPSNGGGGRWRDWTLYLADARLGMGMDGTPPPPSRATTRTHSARCEELMPTGGL